MNKWNIPKNKRKQIIELLNLYFKKLERLTEKQVENMENEQFKLNLTDLGLSPYWVWKVLEEEFNYEKDEFDHNGWELDFWIDFNRKEGKSFPSTCERMCLYGTGMTFELYLIPQEFI